jgi:hypothetical protein
MSQFSEAYQFSRGMDYKSEFIVAVNELIAGKIADRQERMKRIEALINAYVSGIGETPNAKQLERLTDYTLMEELTDRHPDKVSREEYPFMSDWQLDLRRDNECGLKITEDTGTDGMNYKPPTRRKRTSSENESVDKFAKIRNEERRKQYRKDTAPGEIVTYHIDPEALDRHLESTYGVKYKR